MSEPVIVYAVLYMSELVAVTRTRREARSIVAENFGHDPDVRIRRGKLTLFK